MRLSHPLVAAAALALLVAPACAPVRAEAPGGPDEGYASEEPYEPEDAPDPDQYRDNLAPYGEWRDVPDYGVVWRPTYMAGWQPYVDGYWAWTSYGWTWVSYEPWAWTLHYGRWALAPAYGWVWVPGTVWGPAWVDWYWGAGYVGWAPLSPFGSVTVINNFFFVNERDFCSHDVRRHFVHHHHLSDHVRRDWNDRGHRRAPGRDRIERVSRDTVTRFDDRPRNTLAPRRERDRRTVQPELTRARRDREARRDDDVRRPRPETGSRSGWDDRARTDTRLRERQPRFDADDERLLPRRAPSMGGWTGPSRVQPRPDRRDAGVRGPRFDRDDSGRVQVRPHAWGAVGGARGDAPRVRDNPSSLSEAGTARGGGERQGGGGGRGRAGGTGMSMGTGMGVGMGMGMGMGGASPGGR